MLDVGGFWVLGDWDESIPPDDKPIIRLAPHPMVFGTGTHVTTRTILSKLHDLILPNMTVLDVGAGTGIVLFAAGRLGADKLIAVEQSEDAIEALVTNSKTNGLNLDIRRGLWEEVTVGRCDLGICNLGGETTLLDVLARIDAATLLLVWQRERPVVEATMVANGWRELERVNLNGDTLSVLERA